MERVSDDVRLNDSPVMRRRRWGAGWMLPAAGAYAAVAVYQYGILRHRPEPPLAVLDADRVDASGEAYVLGHTRDAGTLAVVGLGQRTGPSVIRGFCCSPRERAVGNAAAGLGCGEQFTKHRRLCGWCTLAVAATLPRCRSPLPRLTRRGAPWTDVDGGVGMRLRSTALSDGQG